MAPSRMAATLPWVLYLLFMNLPILRHWVYCPNHVDLATCVRVKKHSEKNTVKKHSEKTPSMGKQTPTHHQGRLQLDHSTPIKLRTAMTIRSAGDANEKCSTGFKACFTLLHSIAHEVLCEKTNITIS